MSKLLYSKYDINTSLFTEVGTDYIHRKDYIKSMHKYLDDNNVRCYQEFMALMFSKQKICPLPTPCSVKRTKPCSVGMEVVLCADVKSNKLWIINFSSMIKTAVCWVHLCGDKSDGSKHYLCRQHEEKRYFVSAGIRLGNVEMGPIASKLINLFIAATTPQVQLPNDTHRIIAVQHAFCQKIMDFNNKLNKSEIPTKLYDAGMGQIVNPSLSTILSVKLSERIFTYNAVSLWYSLLHQRFFYKYDGDKEWIPLCRHQILTRKQQLFTQIALHENEKLLDKSIENEDKYFTCLRPTATRNDFCSFHLNLFINWMDVVHAGIMEICEVEIWTEMDEEKMNRFIFYLQQHGSLNYEKYHIRVELDDQLEIVIFKGNSQFRICENFRIKCRSIYDTNETCPKCTTQIHDYGVAVYFANDIEMYYVVKAKRAVGSKKEFNYTEKLRKFATSPDPTHALKVKSWEKIPTKAEAESLVTAALLLLTYENSLNRYGNIKIGNMQVSFGSSPWRSFVGLLHEANVQIQIFTNVDNTLDVLERKFTFEESYQPLGEDAHVIYRCTNSVLKQHYIGKTVSFKHKGNVISLYHSDKQKDKSGYSKIQTHGGTTDMIIGKTTYNLHTLTESLYILAYLFAEEFQVDCDMNLSNQILSNTQFHKWNKDHFFRDISFICTKLFKSAFQFTQPHDFNAKCFILTAHNVIKAKELAKPLVTSTTTQKKRRLNH